MSDFFVVSGLRWIRPGPKKTEWFSLEERIDAILDAHLWFLPIPRYAEKIQPYAKDPSLDMIKKNILDLKGPEITNAEEADVFYNATFPHLFLLRDKKMSIQRHVYLICLLVLDMSELQKISVNVPKSNSFISNAVNIIKDYFEPSDGLIDLLCDLDEYVCKTKDAVPKIQSHWIRFADVDPTVTGELSTYVEKKISEMRSVFSKDVLRNAAYISSLVEEEPAIGFNL